MIYKKSQTHIIHSDLKTYFNLPDMIVVPLGLSLVILLTKLLWKQNVE